MAKRIDLVGATWLRRWFGAAAACAVALAGCGDKETAKCTEGAENCACLTGDVQCRGDNLFCAAGTCRKISCVPGELNCSCFPNMTCGKSAAGDALVCDRGLCSPPSCDQGTSGCGCYPNETCNTGLSCGADGDTLRCVPEGGCTPGENGCACLPDSTCTGVTSTGAALQCVDGKCGTAQCPAGTLACPCTAQGTCNDGLDCTAAVGSTTKICAASNCAGKDGTTGCQCTASGTCTDSNATCSANKLCTVDPTCTQGAENCGCLPDSTCTGKAAGGNPLVCSSGKCIAGCVPGEKACACKSDHTCNSVLSCNLTSGLCEDASCVAGELGCKCLTDKTCNDTTLTCGADGLCAKTNCVAGTLSCPCLSDQSCGKDGDGTPLTCVSKTCQNCRKTACATPGLSVPKAAYCYTPCRAGYTDTAGVYHDCGPDGLMRHAPDETCFDAKKCNQGSCVGPSDTLPSCTSDFECPDYQNCVTGRCYSVCDSDGDCPSGLDCYRHACRIPCDSSSSICPEHTACAMVDATKGHCMPVGLPPKNAPTGVVNGTFDVSSENITFDSAHVNDSFTITNNGPLATVFKISKLEHTEDEGVTRVVDNPMPWLQLGEAGSEKLTNSFTVTVTPGKPATINLKGAATAKISRWQGVIEVRSEDKRLGARNVNLAYAGTVNGRWAGTIYYFSNFGTTNLDAWVADRTNHTKLQNVGNALVGRWGDFRYVAEANPTGKMSRAAFEAVLQSTITESWKWPTVRTACKNAAECYPYADGSSTVGIGVSPFSSGTSEPIPTGVTELPIALDIAANATDPTLFEGKIPTGEALHYPGNPKITVRFDSSPTAATCLKVNNGECVVFAQSLASTINVGGRYLLPGLTSTGTCTGTWKTIDTPWLVPGFNAGTEISAADGIRYRRECRDLTQPYTNNPNGNLGLAAGNPIPDGVTRTRRLELIDGAMIDQSTIILFMKESFDSFLPNDASQYAKFSVYGVMSLKRSPAQVDSYDGASPPKAQTPPASAKRTLACSSSLLAKLGVPNISTSANAQVATVALLDGLIPQGAAPIKSDNVHYLCHDTGRIDGGDTSANGGQNFECPAGSNVAYFYFDAASSVPDAATIAALPCQNDGTCQKTIDNWRANNSWQISTAPPIYRCLPVNGVSQVFCDTDRGDLKKGKDFYRVSAASPSSMVPLRTIINDAFRYKTQFRTRTGKTIGFAPEACVPESNAVPYCYDAPAIEDAKDRVDCALEIFSKYPTLSAPLLDYLKINFAYSQTINPPIYTYDGFETMFAELMVMLGDDAYTASFASRFDLAGANKVSFQGALFEPGGINLSSSAGYEMHKLYQATQYYNAVLERLYDLVPFITTSTGEYQPFIKKDATDTKPAPIFTAYFPKVVRASAQKTRAWSEVAKRYQSFNRPALARSVVERAYTSAFLELSVIRNLVTRYLSSAPAENAAEVIATLRQASLTYAAALYDMRDVYQRLTDDVTYFGFAPDYIPFPALESSDSNAFAKLLAIAKQRLSVAAEKEQLALTSDRSYETDAASFQSELVKLRINYDNQLADICGTFNGDDGGVYPAVPRHASLSAKTAALGDPCGFVGSGKLYDAMGQLESIEVDMRSVQLKYDTLFNEVNIEKKRVTQQCAIADATAEARYRLAGQERKLQSDIDQAQIARMGVTAAIDMLDKMRQSVSCLVIAGVAAGTDCPAKMIAYGSFQVGAAIQHATDIALQARINAKQSEIASLQAAEGYWEGLQQCQVAQIDSNALIANKLLTLKDIDLQALKAEYSLRLALSQIQQYQDQSKRIANEMQEMEEQTINVEAARNDPNVRIYKNDAIITADRTFESAIAAAYQATKVFEYYTSQSYGRRDNLFLIRMVSHGDYSLENYIAEIEDAYLGFQQQFGNPDTRVDILSLRDDVFAIPRLDEQGQAMSQTTRISRFRERLQDVALLDEQGYLTVPFATSLARLSPLTRNHKLRRIEAEVVGSNVGDGVGRIYLRQRGTGVVRSVGGDSIYYRFPELTAVVNTFFNGMRALSPEVYSSDRMRDRPYINSRWDFVLNQRDEASNKDVDLSSLTDIRLYLYYTDFTAQ